MYDERTRLARDVEREIRQHFRERVFKTMMPRNVRLGEAPSLGKPIIHMRPRVRARRHLGVGETRLTSVAASSRSAGLGRGLDALLRRARRQGEGPARHPRSS